MSTQRQPTGRTRDRGLRRIRQLTVGATVAGVAAAGGFGLLASATYAGSQDLTALTIASGTNSTSSSQARTGTSSASTATPTTPPAQLSQASSAPTSVSGAGHVSTGGS